MKKLSTALLVIFSTLATAASHHHETSDPAALHGMLLFGKNRIYASHLPMFHSPHDYQVILELELEDHAMKIYKQSLLSDPKEKIYTIAPRPFVLPDVALNKKSFPTSVFKGHFERGGKEIVRHTIAKITNVIYFKKFDPSEKKEDVPSYLVFGSVNEPFLTHLITAAPDFDHILKADSLSKPILNKLARNGKVIHTFPQIPGNEPISESNTEIGVLKEIYLEIDELK